MSFRRNYLAEAKKPHQLQIVDGNQSYGQWMVDWFIYSMNLHPSNIWVIQSRRFFVVAISDEIRTLVRISARDHSSESAVAICEIIEFTPAVIFYSKMASTKRLLEWPSSSGMYSRTKSSRARAYCSCRAGSRLIHSTTLSPVRTSGPGAVSS